MFTDYILSVTFCSMGTLVRRKKTWPNSARKIMEFGQLMIGILVNVSCKFEMYIFKITRHRRKHAYFVILCTEYISDKVFGVSWKVIRSLCLGP